MKTSDFGLNFQSELPSPPWLPYRFVETVPETLFWGTSRTSVGDVTLVFAEEGIAYLGFEEERSLLKLRGFFPAVTLKKEAATAKVRIGSLFEAWRESLPPVEPLAFIVRGTDFQQAVWHALMRIPRESVVSYGTVATSIGNSKAVRAVGSAVGANPISLLIPCHRVVRRNGSVENYGWGDALKQSLLRVEGQTG